MGRSVNYLSNASIVIYFQSDALSGVDEDGNYDDIIAQINWDDFYSNLKLDIKSKLKSYVDCEKWDNNEVSIFLENELCEIAISEYCGLYSLSVRVIEQDYYADDNRANFGENHAKQIEKSLVKILNNLGCNVLNRLGTMSNGVGVFEKANV